MLRLVSLFSLLLVALAPALAQRLVTQTATLAAGQRVALKLPYAARIRVRPGTGTTLTVQARVTINDNQQNEAFSLKLSETPQEVAVAEELNEELLRQVNYRGRCEGTTNNGTHESQRYRYCIQVQYEVSVPTTAALHITSISGDVDAQNLAGAVALTTVSGDLNLRQLSGPVEVRSTSGDLTLHQLTGVVKGRTVSGDVKLTEPGNQPVQLTSVSGNVAATWPAARAATLALKSVTGEVYADPAVTFSNLRPDSRVGYELHGSYGSAGGPAVQLESVSGDVFFRKQ